MDHADLVIGVALLGVAILGMLIWLAAVSLDKILR